MACLGRWSGGGWSRIMRVMGIDDGLTGEIVRRILGVSEPDRIILFGSAATGKMTRDSDIDLLVVAPSPSNTIEERLQLRRSLRGLRFPFDVFIIATGRFEESKNIFGGIAYPAHKYGRVIYEAA
jgi:predicted nucleotidyltransferase